MKLKFKVQPYQSNAVEAVLDCFARLGRPPQAGVPCAGEPARFQYDDWSMDCMADQTLEFTPW